METKDNIDNNNGNSLAYILHIRKLYEEYEQIQMEYSRLRQQMNDNVILSKNEVYFSNENNNNNNNNRMLDDIRNELECEKALNKSYKAEVAHLLDQVRKHQKIYWDLVTVVKNDKETLGLILNTFLFLKLNLYFLNIYHICLANSSINGEKKEELYLQISQLESENKDLKENIDFITSENLILTDSLKDQEEAHFKDMKEWLEEKEKYEEVVVWSKNIYETSKTNM